MGGQLDTGQEKRVDRELVCFIWFHFESGQKRGETKGRKGKKL